MFGIGLPEMLVILAVALIVVGPDKLPDLARSVAKVMLDLKKTVNQVKDSLADEENLIGSVKSDLYKTADELKGNLLEAEHFTTIEPEKSPEEGERGEDQGSVDADRQADSESTAAEHPVPDADRPAGKRGEENPDRQTTATEDPDAAKK